MPTYVDPSQQTPLFIAQQITCAYPISDFYASVPRYLYYSLLVGCFLLKWHPWLSDAFLGAAGTYAGVAAIETFILFGGYPKTKEQELVTIPYVDEASLQGNETLSVLANLVVNSNQLPVQAAVMELDIDAILAIVVTGYLFMLPIHCWSTHVRGHRARHLLMGLWNLLMLTATIFGLILWPRLSQVPYQYRFCYPTFPDLGSVTNDGWLDSLWAGSWNATVRNIFADPNVYNRLTDNCFYPCFNTSQVLRRPQSIAADLSINESPRTSNLLDDTELSHEEHLVYFMYGAIAISAFTAVLLLAITMTGMKRFTSVPLHRPILLWTERGRIKDDIMADVKNVFRRKSKRVQSEKKAESKAGPNSMTFFELEIEAKPKRRKSLIHLIGNLAAMFIVFIVVVVIPATWVIFIVWIEWWIHRDLVSEETPRQVGQWAPAASVALVAVSAAVMKFKYSLATKEEVDCEIAELSERLEKLQKLRNKKQ